MTKNEIKKAIENAAAKIENGNYDLFYAGTAAIYGGKIPFDLDDGEETYTDENGDEVVKVVALIEKDENGEVSVIVDNGSCNPAIYTAAEFAEEYGK